MVDVCIMADINTRFIDILDKSRFLFKILNIFMKI